MNNILPKPKAEITMFIETMNDLRFNPLIVEYYNSLKKFIEEGYTLKFNLAGYTDDYTLINDINHLKNFFNDVNGIKCIE